MQRDTDTWLTDLQSDGDQQAVALDDLREILMRILPKALSQWLHPADPHFTPLMEDIAQETLLRVLARLDTFEGRSKFTTWVYTIAVRIGLSKLRLRKWQEISLESFEMGDNAKKPAFARLAPRKNSPETSVAQINALELVLTAMKEALTPYQHEVMSAVILQDVPLDVLAARMGKDRSTLYKVMYDARVKLKQHLTKSGHPPEELLADFMH